ncbi:MAG TPA: patatin-like phospholipase family protein [Acidimicrobiales bacterium]|nr:patatin-like phospholipase family protein [Acidimicrobiales bacterium]
MARIGLVLGAGGMAGIAYHAGVLAGLAEGVGWDPREADLIVGTSAGSLIAAGLRAGLSAADIAARAEGSPLSPEGAALLEASDAAVGPSRDGPPTMSLRLRTPAAPGVLLAAGLAPWRIRPAAVIAGLLPPGSAPTEALEAGLDALYDDRWPARPMWVCAVHLDSGRLTVFGRDGAPRARVGEAVAASCAIPGYFAPVPVNGARYVDGGAHSLTNLSEVARLGLDLVIVSAPMSRTGRRRPTSLVVRELARLELGVEARRVRRRGAAVLAFQPTAADQATAGLNFMNPARQAAIARQARASTLRRLERADVRERLAMLRG